MRITKSGRTLRAIWAAGIIAWLTSAAGAAVQGGSCGVSEQDCCVAGAVPGCKDEACCGVICALDAFCCATQWDEICATEAQDSCASCVCGSGNCCAPHSSSGCSDPECCSAVCIQDPFCCESEWDGGCVILARGACGVLCPYSCAPPSHTVTEIEQCLQDLNGTCGNMSNQVIQIGTSLKGCTWAFAPVRTGPVLITTGSPTVFQSPQHGLENDDRVTFSTDGNLPNGLIPGEGYFVRSAATNSFQVSATLGGDPVATSGSQSGAHRFTYVGVPQRDIDRYRLNLSIPTRLALKVSSESLCFAEVLRMGDCANVLMRTRSDPELGECPSSGEVCLAAGTYEILVAPDAFTGVPYPPIPGSPSNEYVLQLSGQPCDAGPPSNDVCLAATPIVLDLDAGIDSAELDFENRFATTDPVPPTCGSTGAAFTQDLYWTLTPPPGASGDYLISTCQGGVGSTSFDTGIEVWSGCPLSGGSLLACNDDGELCNFQDPKDGGLRFASSLYVDLQAGVPYIIRIGGWDGAVGDATLSVRYVGSRPTCSDAGAPSCCGDPEDGQGPFCDEAPCCELTCGVDGFCCAISWDSVCVDFARRFCSVCGGGSLGASDTCAGALVPGAPVLTVGSSMIVRTADASTEYQAASCDGTTFVNKDVYLTFSAPYSGSFAFDTCSGGSTVVDTVIEAWSGCPETGGTLLACNDETAQVGCIPLRSRLNVSLVAGQVVLIRVGSADSTAGDFSIRASEGDEGVSCADPGVLQPGKSIFSRADSVQDLPLGSGCTLVGGGTNTLWNVVWFEYVPQRTGPCTVSTCSPATNHDTTLGVFTSCDPTSVIACNDDACNSVASEVTFDAVCGQRYLVAIGGSSPSTSLGSGVVEVSQSGPECPPPLVGDLDGDGVVNGADLGIMLTSWGSAGAGDLNGDGIVDGADLGIILTSWTP